MRKLWLSLNYAHRHTHVLIVSVKAWLLFFFAGVYLPLFPLCRVIMSVIHWSTFLLMSARQNSKKKKLVAKSIPTITLFFLCFYARIWKCMIHIIYIFSMHFIYPVGFKNSNHFKWEYLLVSSSSLCKVVFGCNCNT